MSQHYINIKSKLQESLTRFFEENLDENRIFKTQWEKRVSDDDWIWDKKKADNQEIFKQEDQRGKYKTFDVIKPGYHPDLKNLLFEVKEKEEDKQAGRKEGHGKIVEPYDFLGKIEGYLDYILTVSLNNYTGIRKKKKNNNIRNSGKCKRKKKKIGFITKEDILKCEMMGVDRENKTQKIEVEEILKIDNMVKTQKNNQ